MIALGFVVARFSLFVALVSASGTSQAAAHAAPGASNPIGIALVVLGTVLILGALVNHRAFVRTLPAQDVPRPAVPWLATFMALSVALIGLVLALYLAVA